MAMSLIGTNSPVVEIIDAPNYRITYDSRWGLLARISETSS